MASARRRLFAVVTIEETTLIRAPIERCFDLSLSIDLPTESTCGTEPSIAPQQQSSKVPLVQSGGTVRTR